MGIDWKMPLNYYSQSKKRHPTLYFSRAELSSILSAYARRVASRDWRDYALDHREHCAIFSIFKHAHEHPLFTIEKHKQKGSDAALFILQDRKKTRYRTTKLTELISYLNRLPRLIQK